MSLQSRHKSGVSEVMVAGVLQHPHLPRQAHSHRQGEGLEVLGLLEASILHFLAVALRLETSELG